MFMWKKKIQNRLKHERSSSVSERGMVVGASLNLSESVDLLEASGEHVVNERRSEENGQRGWS